jgi:phosphohistidine phosphatase SixA
MHTIRPAIVAAISWLVALSACQSQQPAVVVTPRPAPTTAPTAVESSTTSTITGSLPSAPAIGQPGQALADCTFAYGFAAMVELVGPATVGECTEDERQIPGNGNAEQMTKNGRLVYRAIDGRVLFANASQTWINRDGTTVTRPENQRFEWEGDRLLVEALQRGGYIVYFRHGPTDPTERDSDPTNLANCSTQRNLTDGGRAQARATGEAFRALNIPVGQVLSSEYCRAVEYARLAFDKAELTASLVLPDPLTEPEKARNTAQLKGLLATAPQVGTNTIMVSHSPNIRLAADVDLPAEGGAAVFQVEGQDPPRLVARVLPEEWMTLAQAMSTR